MPAAGSPNAAGRRQGPCEYSESPPRSGIPTGFPRLDEMTGGLETGELFLLAARPSIGKTALALNIAANVAIRQGRYVGIFSLEMSKESLLERLIVSEARVP